jgi:hypothetical protein
MSNYPDGAAHDPAAPWNQDDRYEREVEQYISDAEGGANTDWATYDVDAAAAVLAKVYRALRYSPKYLEPDPVFLQFARREALNLIEVLIQRHAERHAESVLESCTCPRDRRYCPVHGRDADAERDRAIDDELTGDR